MPKDLVKKELQVLINKLDETQDELQEKDILYDIMNLCRTRTDEIVKSCKIDSWNVAMLRHKFYDDCRNYIMSYIKENNIPFYAEMWSSYAGYGIYIKKDRDVRQNLHGLQTDIRNDIKTKTILEYAGINPRLRAISEAEYENFIKTKKADPEYPQRFLKNTIAKLQMLKQEGESKDSHEEA